MNCHAIRSILDLHAERRLTAAREREVAAHLKTCEACAAEAASFGALRSLAGKPAHAPAALKHALESLAAGKPAPAEIPPFRFSLLPSAQSRAALTAAAVYAGLLLALHFAGPSAPTQAYSGTEEAPR